MSKKPFVSKEKLEEIASKIPTPFHLYDERGLRENAKAVKEAFAWNTGFREYFAVKANANPFLIRILITPASQPSVHYGQKRIRHIPLIDQDLIFFAPQILHKQIHDRHC